jgi:DNA polymerase-4
MASLCRDCLHSDPGSDNAPPACPACGSRRLIAHPELFELSTAHIDCDAFYASVEKRDRPELRDKPVIVGGGRRGVVSAACYVARIHGVRSAMPMFNALKACPDAVVIRPDIRKYSAVGKEIRALMEALTPMVEPISIDEAFLDLSGTHRLHKAPPAVSLAKLVKRIEEDIGVSASIGLAYNKFLAKVASDLDKPRGFAVLGRTDARAFLAEQSVTLIWGVGKALAAKMAKDGLTRIAQLQTMEKNDLIARYGSMGSRLYHFSRGEDDRRIHAERAAKSVSAETTFDTDISEADALAARLWPLCEKVAKRMKAGGHMGGTVTLKLKTKAFRSLTRNRQLAAPTQLAEAIYRAALPMLRAEATGAAYRLIGVGLSDLFPAQDGGATDLFDAEGRHDAAVERAIDAVRDKMGDAAITKGRGFKSTAGRKRP